MATVKKMSDHRRLAPDIPLPGHYRVLTAQLNVTRYQSEKVGRWVLVVREPQEQIELYRGFVDASEWTEAVRELGPAITEALETMTFLQDGYGFQQP